MLSDLNHLTAYTPVIKNKYRPISDYQDLDPQHDSDKIKSKSGDLNKHKIIILGDSHVRGCSEKLASILGNVFSVIAILKPNANMGAISDSTYLKAEKLSKRNVIICGGARDVARNETKEGLRFIFKFDKLLTNTDVIVTCVPHQFDLQAESCRIGSRIV